MQTLKPLDAVQVKGVYRGQHGSPDGAIIQTRLPSITFSCLAAAIEYAKSPNCRNDFVVAPRVVKADLRIDRPLPLNGKDCFIEAPLVFAVMGREAGTALLIREEDQIYSTGNWQEGFRKTFESVADLAEKAPEKLDELYLNAYAVLDDPEFVATAKALGFDGAVHYGNGVTFAELEYRVFSEDQLSNLEVIDLDALLNAKAA